MKRAFLGAFLALGLAPLLQAKTGGTLQVLGLEGSLRLLRFETEPWPLEAGQPLPDNSRIELEAGAKLRLRYRHYLDLCFIGPARLTVYVVPSPTRGEFDEDRVVLKLDEGLVWSDGRFQFGRPADILLSLPERSVVLPRDRRLIVRTAAGRSSFFSPGEPGKDEVFAVALNGSELTRLEAAPPLGPGPELPQALFDELKRPVKVFVIARDFNQDLGVATKPAVLGPLLTERLSKQAGLEVVDGSGDTFIATMAGTALRTGQDFFLKELATARGARWVVVGNGVALTPYQSEAPNGRRVQGEAEVRLLEANAEGLELVSEVGDTRVARAGRPLIQASREAMEAAADEVAGHLAYHLDNLLAGRAHAAVLVKVTVLGTDQDGLRELRSRLGALDSVQRIFRRRFIKGEASLDLTLRKGLADFDAEWAAQISGHTPKDAAYRFEALPSEGMERRLRQSKRKRP